MKFSKGTPKEEGIYLCRVEGYKYTTYAVLMWSDGYWWQYVYKYMSDGSKIEGWAGASNLMIVRWTEIE